MGGERGSSAGRYGEKAGCVVGSEKERIKERKKERIKKEKNDFVEKL